MVVAFLVEARVGVLVVMIETQSMCTLPKPRKMHKKFKLCCQSSITVRLTSVVTNNAHHPSDVPVVDDFPLEKERPSLPSISRMPFRTPPPPIRTLFFVHPLKRKINLPSSC